jgi:hypothetical protein
MRNWKHHSSYPFLARLFLCNTNKMTSASAEESLELSFDESAKESDDDDDDDDNGSVEEGSDAMETSATEEESEDFDSVTKKPPPEAPL